MRFRHSIAAAVLFCAAAPAFTQVITQAQCEENRGLVRSGKVGGPAFDVNNPISTRVITFDDFKKIKWTRGTNPKLFPSQVGQRARITGEESTIFQIDGVDYVGFSLCHRGVELEFVGGSTTSSPIIGALPMRKCMEGSKYAPAADEFMARYTQLYSIWSP